MAARNRRIEPAWYGDDEEKFQKHRETVEDAARELAKHDVDEAIQTLQRVREDTISGEFFEDGYQEELDSFRQVDRLREELEDDILELAQYSVEGTLNTIGLEIKRARARRRLQKNKEAFRRMTPERREKAEKKLEEEQEARKQARDE